MRTVPISLKSIRLILSLMILISVAILILKIRPITYRIPGLNEVNRIEVYILVEDSDGFQNKVYPLRTIDDPEKIRQVVAAIGNYTDKWQYDEFSPPYTSSFGKPNPLHLAFYNNDEVQVVLTIGYSKDSPYSLQEVYGPGRYLDYPEFKKLMSLLAIDEEFAYYEK